MALHGGGSLGMLAGERHIRDRCESERRRDHAESGEVGEVALQDHRTDRVADRDERDLGQRQDARAFEIQPDDRADADEADEQPDQARHAEPFTVARCPRDHRADEWHRRDQGAVNELRCAAPPFRAAPRDLISIAANASSAISVPQWP